MQRVLVVPWSMAATNRGEGCIGIFLIPLVDFFAMSSENQDYWHEWPGCHTNVMDSYSAWGSLGDVF
jgi:hypothetical protein